jgi:hypothetical protein
MITKVKLLESIKNLPDRFSIDELLDRLLLLQKIEIGLEQSENNQIISDEQLDDKLKKWLD